MSTYGPACVLPLNAFAAYNCVQRGDRAPPGVYPPAGRESRSALPN